MKDFLLVYRNDFSAMPSESRSPEEMQSVMKLKMDRL